MAKSVTRFLKAHSPPDDSANIIGRDTFGSLGWFMQQNIRHSISSLTKGSFRIERQQTVFFRSRFATVASSIQQRSEN
jgi:diphthamide synthase subunit DPH2